MFFVPPIYISVDKKSVKSPFCDMTVTDNKSVSDGKPVFKSRICEYVILSIS